MRSQPARSRCRTDFAFSGASEQTVVLCRAQWPAVLACLDILAEPFIPPECAPHFVPCLAVAELILTRRTIELALLLGYRA